VLHTPAADTVFITGGSRGIGYATARAFLARGARVAICGHDAARLVSAQRQLARHGEVLAVTADVRDPYALASGIDTIGAQLGPVDVLVNNAGVLWSGRFAGQDFASMAAVIDTNVKGVLHATRAVLPQMLARGRGVIINVASGAGLSGFAGLAAYCASKFAVVGFTESLDLEVRERGIRVYAICPGSVQTDKLRQYSAAARGMAPEFLAERIVSLAAAGARAPTGTCIPVP
jgi:3-oxoacyl-[acyl-carrier protein] reductase